MKGLSLYTRTLIIVLSIFAVLIVIALEWNYITEKKRLMAERVRASETVAEIILQSIYVDMMEGRADIARYLIDTLKQQKKLKRLQLIRTNGVEAAFKDKKTLISVKNKIGFSLPEWLRDHPDEENNMAEGVNDRSFKEAMELFKENWKREPIYYVEEDGISFTYLQPVYARKECFSCHSEEEARGILMVTTSLEDIYTTLAKHRKFSLLAGILSMAVVGLLLAFFIERSIINPLKATIDVIKNIIKKGGETRERVAVNSPDEIGELASYFNQMLDIIEKRDRENVKLIDTIRKSQREWIATFDAIQDLIAIHDKNGVILKANKALARRFNTKPQDIIGKRCEEVFLCDDKSILCPRPEVFKNGKIVSYEMDDPSLGGTYSVTTFPLFDEKGEVVAAVHVARDITKEKMLKSQLLQSEKMSSLGKLVAGIAHEINNPLMGITGFCQLIMDMPDDKSVRDIRDKLQKIYREAIRTTKIVQKLLTFARARKPERGYHNINDILKDVLSLREYSLKTSNINIVTELAPDLPHTMVDFYQLQQVFINLINNSVDAILSEEQTGTIYITTRTVKDRMIEIVFRDTGPGLPEDIIEKVFDPFFTTKESGKGTGLGLSISYGIIKEHGGSIDIRNHEEGGAVVTISLPVVEKDETATYDMYIEPQSMASERGKKNLRILVVDDEASIREALSDMLSKEGFSVETARDGNEAFTRLKERDFSLIIADIKMPGMDGKEFYKRVSKEFPTLRRRIILITGDVISGDVKEFIKEKNLPSITKPFNMYELINLIEIILTRGISH